jgi:hypothetical protein
MQSVFQRFEDADWLQLSRMASLQIQKEKYDTLAVETYGEAYLQYKENLTTYTLAQLRAAVNSDNFYNVLRGYIAGISPAFSYGMTI